MINNTIKTTTIAIVTVTSCILQHMLRANRYGSAIRVGILPSVHVTHVVFMCYVIIRVRNIA